MTREAGKSTCENLVRIITKSRTMDKMLLSFQVDRSSRAKCPVVACLVSDLHDCSYLEDVTKQSQGLI